MNRWLFRLGSACARGSTRPSVRARALRAGLLLAAASAASVQGAGAQRVFEEEFNRLAIREGRFDTPERTGLPEVRGSFTFCRLWYTSVRREPSGLGWSTDYTRGDENFLVRLSQLTKTYVSIWRDGQPGHAVVRASDPDLFRCPFLFASDIGTAGFEQEEVDGLRDYFQKGGFLWVDDFWGDEAWQQWKSQIGRILPGFQIVDIPPDHPIMRISYVVHEVPQIPNIGFWRRDHGTSERGEETEQVHFRGIFDRDGRLLVLMTHNTDIADGWEREGESDEFFDLFSPRAYGLAMNIALYVMSR
jgi:hypothetical protein